MAKQVTGNEPFEATAEAMRHAICDAFLTVMASDNCRQLSAAQQLEAMIAGAMTGIMGSSFAFMAPQGRDGFVQFIKGYADIARKQAESMTPMRGAVQ